MTPPVCPRCAGVGDLHSRCANPRNSHAEPITHTESHYACDLCEGSGVQPPKETF